MNQSRSIYPLHIPVIDSATGEIFFEKIWGDSLIQILYGSSFVSYTLGSWMRHFLARMPYVSKIWGKYHNLTHTRRKIARFCTEYGINTQELEKPLEQFFSFNDFFVRKLKPEARPIDRTPLTLTAPADARYTFIPSLSQDMPFTIKGTQLNLRSLLQDDLRAQSFHEGSAIIARLCPVDCHRFFFPAAGLVSCSFQDVRGPLYSVNPKATRKFPWIWWTNRRTITYVDTTENFGSYAMIEVGATNCGSIQQTFIAPGSVDKGQEKGFFTLGGSAIILLFQKNRVYFDLNLQKLQDKYNCEVFCSIGQKIASGLPLK